jgi:hypothetical protein
MWVSAFLFFFEALSLELPLRSCQSCGAREGRVPGLKMLWVEGCGCWSGGSWVGVSSGELVGWVVGDPASRRLYSCTTCGSLRELGTGGPRGPCSWMTWGPLWAGSLQLAGCSWEPAAGRFKPQASCLKPEADGRDVQHLPGKCHAGNGRLRQPCEAVPCGRQAQQGKRSRASAAGQAQQGKRSRASAAGHCGAGPVGGLAGCDASGAQASAGRCLQGRKLVGALRSGRGESWRWIG